MVTSVAQRNKEDMNQIKGRVDQITEVLISVDEKGSNPWFVELLTQILKQDDENANKKAMREDVIAKICNCLVEKLLLCEEGKVRVCFHSSFCFSICFKRK